MFSIAPLHTPSAPTSEWLEWSELARTNKSQTGEVNAIYNGYLDLPEVFRVPYFFQNQLISSPDKSAKKLAAPVYRSGQLRFRVPSGVG